MCYLYLYNKAAAHSNWPTSLVAAKAFCSRFQEGDKRLNGHDAGPSVALQHKNVKPCADVLSGQYSAGWLNCTLP